MQCIHIGAHKYSFNHCNGGQQQGKIIHDVYPFPPFQYPNKHRTLNHLLTLWPKLCSKFPVPCTKPSAFNRFTISYKLQ